jgi:outer membrane protein assembly factor BamB
VDRTSPPATTLQPEWTSPVLDGEVYAQPLLIGSTVIVATENDTVYAFDSASGARLWMRQLATPVPGSALPCGNIDPSGITGTPVADPRTGLLWVVTYSAPFTHTLWSLDLATGAVRSARNANPPGADEPAEQQRGALALDGSMVYIPYGGLYGDCSDYHGWVVGMSTASPVSTGKVTWQTPTEKAGIWAPPGPVVAADGSIYVATGNGVPVNVAEDSDSVIRLSPSLSVEGSFTPADYAELSADDLDLGSTSPVLLPGGLVFEAGKQGVGYVLSGGDLGGIGGQLASSAVCGGGFGGAAVDGDVVYLACFDGLYAVRVTPGTGSRRPSLSVVWSQTGFQPGPPIVAGGIVWAVETRGRLVGFDQEAGAVRYSQAIRVAGSFPSPAAADGRLFVPDGNRLAVFGGV